MLQALPFVNWTNGAIVMTLIFALVIVGLVGFVMYFINSSGKKDRDSQA